MTEFKIILATLFLFFCSEKTFMLSFDVRRIGEIISPGMSEELGNNINVPVNQPREPAIFVEENVTYLLYSVRGENGIAIAKLNIQ